MDKKAQLEKVLRKEVSVWLDILPNGPVFSIVGTLYPSGNQYYVTNYAGGAVDFKLEQVDNVYLYEEPDADAAARIDLLVPNLVLDKQD